MISSTLSVRPVNPPAAYLGGKRNLARRLVTLIDQIQHSTYVEPFVGMGGVFLRRTSAPSAEVINDLSVEVAGLFRILQRHYEAFMGELKWKLTSRADFERLLRTPARDLTDIERAARFLYLQRLAFGGKVRGQTFGVSKGTPARFDVTKLEPMLADIHERLARVVIECLPYAEVIRRYDSAGTLFYLDPPYWGCETDYAAEGFERADFERLASQLSGISGRFVLSINATDGAREVFDQFAIEEVETTYTVSNGAGQRVRELIVTGPSG